MSDTKRARESGDELDDEHDKKKIKLSHEVTVLLGATSNGVDNHITVTMEENEEILNPGFFRKYIRLRKLKSFHNAYICQRREDAKTFIVVSVLQKHFKYDEHKKYEKWRSILPDVGIFDEECEARVYVLFPNFLTLSHHMMITQDSNRLGALLKKSIISLTSTFQAKMVTYLDKNTVFVSDDDDVVFFHYPFLEYNTEAIHSHIAMDSSDVTKKKLLNVLGHIARDAQPLLSIYNHSGEDVTTFSYITTSLIAHRWSPHLAEMYARHIDDAAKVAMVANSALNGSEADIPDPRWTELKRRAGVFVEAQKDSCIYRVFKVGMHRPDIARNVNTDAANAVADIHRHLFDYRSFREVSNHAGSDVTVGKVADKYMQAAPLFRYNIFEVYEDDLDEIIVNYDGY